MKKVVFGALMMLAGTVSSAILLAGAMANEWTVNGQFSFSWNLSQYGLMPALVIFVLIAIVGLGIGVGGMFDRKD